MSRQVQYAATPSSPDVDVESRDLIGEHEVDKYLEDQHSGAGSSSGSRTWRIVFFLQLTVLLGLVGYVVYLTQFIQQQQQRQLALMGDQQLQAQTFQELQREEAREAAKKSVSVVDYRPGVLTIGDPLSTGFTNIDPKELECLTKFPIPTIHELGLKYNTDKVNMHTYDALYDFWFAPYRCRPLKMLEIGLGCDMHYGPGHSYHMWLEYFPFVELHYLEYDGRCVKEKAEELKGAKQVHVGDQADPEVLKKLLRESGGDFDIIIDDGGHKITQQLASFEWLFKYGVKPGGLFVMEDILTSRDDMMMYHDAGPMTLFVKYGEYIRQLMDEQSPPQTDIQWVRQMSCGVGMCVFQKYSNFDIENWHLGSAGMAHHTRGKPELPNPKDYQG